MNEALFPPAFFRALERIARRAPRPGAGARVAPGRGIAVRGYERRPWRHGDPLRAVDWRSSARGHAWQVRERERERGGTLWLWLDRSASVAAAGPARDVAQRRLALALAWLALDAGAEVRLLAGDRPRAGFRGGDRRAAVQRWLEALPPPRGRDVEPHLPARGPGRGRAHVLTDPWAGSVAWSAWEAARPGMTALQWTALVPAREDRPPPELLELVDAETGARRVADLRAGAGRFRTDWRRHLDLVTARARAAGMTPTLLRCGDGRDDGTTLLADAEAAGVL